VIKYRLLLINLVLGLTVMGAWWGRSTEAADVPRTELLKHMSVPFRDWQPEDILLSPDEVELLQPDDAVVRRYYARDRSNFAEIAVIAGHRKRTVHTPGFCMAGSGWETILQRPANLNLPTGAIPVTRMISTKERQRILTTYLFTDGDFVTNSLPRFMLAQVTKRLRGRIPIGAMVRVVVPVTTDDQDAEKLTVEFAAAVFPHVFRTLKTLQVKAG
jgi:EpsI family protein